MTRTCMATNSQQFLLIAFRTIRKNMMVQANYWVNAIVAHYGN